MAFAEDPVLIVWEAMNLLTEVDRLSELPEISKMRADAEMILIHMITALMQHSDNRDSPAPPGFAQSEAAPQCARAGISYPTMNR